MRTKIAAVAMGTMMAFSVALSPVATDVASAHPVCKNNKHNHYIAGTHWYVYKVTQVGPNQIKKHWKYYFSNHARDKYRGGTKIC